MIPRAAIRKGSGLFILEERIMATLLKNLPRKIAECAQYLADIDELREYIEDMANIAMSSRDISREQFDEAVKLQYEKIKEDKPTKMTLKQLVRFEELWEETLTWIGEDNLCNGLYEEFGGDAYKICTYVEIQNGLAYLMIFENEDESESFFSGEILLDHRAKFRFREYLSWAMNGKLDEIMI